MARHHLDNEVSRRYYEKLKKSKKYLTPIWVETNPFNDEGYFAIGDVKLTTEGRYSYNLSNLQKLDSAFNRQLPGLMFFIGATEDELSKSRKFESKVINSAEKLDDYVDKVLFDNGVNPRKIGKLVKVVK